MKRLALLIAVAAMATLACGGADRQGQQGDTVTTDTSSFQTDTTTMTRDTAKQM